MSSMGTFHSFLIFEIGMLLFLAVALPVVFAFLYVWASRTGKWSYNPNARSQSSYFSTPEHLRSFIGRFVYIYTGKGTITLDPDALTIAKSGISSRIPFSEIVELRVGAYSKWAKPITLKYIALSYRVENDAQTILLTPAVSWTAPVWKTNEIVETWYERLQQARKAQVRPLQS